jgi:4-amino-4-deoxy-L-arabinose transferase-like glycosyltransferase
MRYLKHISPVIYIVLLLSLAGSVMIFYSTYWGPWAYSDSTEYIASARSLLGGHGLGFYSPAGNFKPLTLHAPFYPIFLSAVGLVGIDLIAAARWVNILLFGATIFITGALTYRLFRSAWLSLSFCIMLLTLPALVDVSSGAMAELLFIFTCILGACLLFIYLAEGKPYQLILSAVSIGLAGLSRYPGVILIPACVIALLITGHAPLKRKLIDAFKFCLVSLAPTALWVIWIYSRTATVADRQYHLPSNIWAETTQLRQSFMDIFWSWLPYHQQLPAYSYNLSRNIFIALCVLVIILSGLILYRKFLSRQQPAGQEFTFALFWMIFVLGTAIFIVASSVYTTPIPDLNARTLLPVQVGLLFALLALVAAAIKEFHLPTIFGWVSTGIILLFCISYGHTSWNIVKTYHQDGAGYTSKAWHNSLTVDAARALPENTSIISNQAAAVLLLLDRPAYDYCTPNCASNQARFGDDPLDPVQQVFRQDKAALVIFYPTCGALEQSWYTKDNSQMLSQTKGLVQSFSACDGAIYYYPSPAHN